MIIERALERIPIKRNRAGRERGPDEQTHGNLRLKCDAMPEILD